MHRGLTLTRSKPYNPRAVTHSTLLSEIAEQPDVIARLIDAQTASIKAIAAQVRAAAPRFVTIAARGTSDNAARYAQYVFGSHNGMTTALATPSLYTAPGDGGQRPALRDALVIGISQSGQSPDIVEVVKAGRRDGALTIAITNDPASPLANAAAHTIALGAGVERSVAATKTYTAQLTALAMLASCWRHSEPDSAMRALPDAARKALGAQDQAQAAAQALAQASRCVVLGRGYHYATAFEAALKIKELTYLLAEPYSSADFKHGPMALIEGGFPVILIASGAAFKGEFDALRTMLADRKATVVTFADAAHGPRANEYSVDLASASAEWLSPISGIIPAQLLAYHLARARGHNPDAPRTISKVTLTR
jgi:glucosamine--fructose-6-phosphate aminotransferase (isomerizing)